MHVLRSNQIGIDEDNDDNSMTSQWSSIIVVLRLALWPLLPARLTLIVSESLNA